MKKITKNCILNAFDLSLESFEFLNRNGEDVREMLLELSIHDRKATISKLKQISKELKLLKSKISGDLNG